MAPLDRVRAAGEALRAAEEARDRARDELRAALIEARNEGIALTVVAQAAGISHKAARTLVGST
jgi:DNA-binding IclR family transcriptional regulator